MRMIRWMLVIAVACVACGGGRPKDPKVALAIAVGMDMGCMGDEVMFTPEPAPGGGTRYHVMCLKQRAIYVVRDGEAVMEAPNSENKHVRKIAMKASFAFKCHPAEISVESLDKDRTFGGVILPSRAIAKGCGQEATYVQHDGGFEEEGASARDE